MEPESRASKLEKLNRLTGIHLGLRYRIIILDCWFLIFWV